MKNDSFEAPTPNGRTLLFCCAGEGAPGVAPGVGATMDPEIDPATGKFPMERIELKTLLRAIADSKYDGPVMVWLHPVDFDRLRELLGRLH